MRALGVLVLLVACAAPQPPPQPAFVVPEDLRSCRAARPEPAAPPLPRTVQTIADAYNLAKEIGQGNEAARNDCAAKLDRLNKLVSP